MKDEPVYPETFRLDSQVTGISIPIPFAHTKETLEISERTSIKLPMGFFRLGGEDMPDEPPGIWCHSSWQGGLTTIYVEAWETGKALEDDPDNLRYIVECHHQEQINQAKSSPAWTAYWNRIPKEHQVHMRNLAERPWMVWAVPEQVIVHGIVSLLLVGRSGSNSEWLDSERCLALPYQNRTIILRVRALAPAEIDWPSYALQAPWVTIDDVVSASWEVLELLTRAIEIASIEDGER